MNNKQYRMLELLDGQISECVECELHTGGRCKPYWTEDSKYVIVGEAPGKNEVEQNKPFCGTAGNHLWGIMKLQGFHREDFLIINSTNCRPVVGNKNGKPNLTQIQTCRKWIRKYLTVLKPEAILILGNYAMGTMSDQSFGIMSMNSEILNNDEFGCRMILSVHPSMCIYRGKEGQQMLLESAKALRSIL